MTSVLSLGAGVQSTTMLLMAAAGEIDPMPRLAIFADTQAEPPAVYRHLGWLRSLDLPIPIDVVTAGSLVDEIGATGNGKWPSIPIPAHFLGKNGRSAMLNRSCTKDYKIDPIRRRTRELVGIVGKKSPAHPVVEQWIGISTDEAQRMKDSGEPWRKNRWPLIEKRMSRRDCLAWLVARGYPEPPKSSCTFCPYHNTAGWRAVRSDPAAWAQALDMERRVRDMWPDRLPNPGIYLHWSLRPLEEVVHDDSDQRELFGNECEGVCGV